MSATERLDAFYLCPEGHQTDRSDFCPVDGKRVEPAAYHCAYCGYARMKGGRCPNCDALMQPTGLVSRKPKIA